MAEAGSFAMWLCVTVVTFSPAALSPEPGAVTIIPQKPLPYAQRAGIHSAARAATKNAEGAKGIEQSVRTIPFAR